MGSNQLQRWGALLVLAACVVTGSAIMCSVCDSKQDKHCKEHAPPPVNCSYCHAPLPDGSCALYAHFNYCLSVEKYDENSTLISFTRSCSPITSRGKNYYCKSGVEKGKTIKMCLFFCATDGCNSGRAVSASSLCLTISLLAAGVVKLLF